MKTETERRFDEVSKKYFQAFGKRYPLMITDQRSLKDHIAIMLECLEKNEPQKESDLSDKIY